MIVGEWPEQDSGLFDRTHLKWFTYKSIIKLFTDANLNIYSIKPRIFNGNKAVNFVEALKPALQTLGLVLKFLAENCTLAICRQSRA